LIVRAALVVVLLVVLWACFAQVEEVTRGDGKVVPSKQLQVVQSLDGGVVSEILVQEGQVVEAGQLLLKIDETRATSGVRESAAQGFALRARGAAAAFPRHHAARGAVCSWCGFRDHDQPPDHRIHQAV
jgi:adhesin transport system membrane fusion protein